MKCILTRQIRMFAAEYKPFMYNYEIKMHTHVFKWQSWATFMSLNEI